ncbi:MAG: hypothetical protein ACI8W8_004425 [Rhodothermales bacterium]|jgi:hypothetical protein
MNDLDLDLGLPNWDIPDFEKREGTPGMLALHNYVWQHCHAHDYAKQRLAMAPTVEFVMD